MVLLALSGIEPFIAISFEPGGATRENWILGTAPSSSKHCSHEITLLELSRGLQLQLSGSLEVISIFKAVTDPSHVLSAT